MFDNMAGRVRAGDNIASVLHDFGFQPEMAPSPSSEVSALAERVKVMEPAFLFAGKILDNYADNWASDFDGGTLEDWADECGLMVWIDMPNDSDEQSRCSNCEGDCDRCHRYTPAASAARKAALSPERAQPAPGKNEEQGK